MTGDTLSGPAAAAERFKSSDKIIGIREFGNGNINQTFLVTLNGEGEKHFVLQRINTRVFSRPELVMRNMRIVTGHMRQHLQLTPSGEGRRWEVPQVLLTWEGKDHWTGPDGSFWRAISFIENAQSFDTVKDVRHAGEIGHALGIFHNLLCDLPSGLLADTLKGFHITPRYLRHYEEVLAKYSASKSPEVSYCLNFVNARSAWAHVLETAGAQGKLNLRTIHGDPKVNNFMIDITTGQAVGIIDLDTVKPGLVHYDIGDCLRSGCNPLGENGAQQETVYFDTDICRAILHGYLRIAREFLTANDFDYIFDSVRLLAFELGLRFFTDYLEGNVYFRVGHQEHNLTRALVQFKLTESIELQEKTIRKIITEMR